MSDQTASISDEIDLFAVAHTLWSRKVLVLLAACAGLIFGLVGSYVLPAGHKISVQTSINYHSLKSGYLCPDIRTRQRCLSNIDFSFASGFSALLLKNQQIELQGHLTADQSVGTVRTRLEELINNKSLQMYEEATEYLDYAKSLGVNQMATEAAAEEVVRAHFIISQFQRGVPFAKLGAARLFGSRPTAIVISAIAAVCMILLACIFVLIETAHSNWKRNQPG